MNETIDIILLTYNRQGFLQQMVESLEAHTQWPYRLTIVDNASQPATRQWLRDNEQRFHQIIWRTENSHLAAFQDGIAATSSSRYILSDADLVVPPPTADGCWLTRLIHLADAHPDFGLLGCSLDSQTSARTTKKLLAAQAAPGPIVEAPTGVWLNLVQRAALTVPFVSDGLACYALQRRGYRVGAARDIQVHHLGDDDAAMEPEYLAGKRQAHGIGVLYPDYEEEAAQLQRPPSLQELGWAAPLADMCERHQLDTQQAVEVRQYKWPVIGNVYPHMESLVLGEQPAVGTYHCRPHHPWPLHPDGVQTLILSWPDEQTVANAMRFAATYVVVLTDRATIPLQPGWQIVDEQPGLHPVAATMFRMASRSNIRQRLGWSTVSNQASWVQAAQAMSLPTDDTSRCYLLRRQEPRDIVAPQRWAATAQPPTTIAWSPPRRDTRHHLQNAVTKIWRFAWVEYQLYRHK